MGDLARKLLSGMGSEQEDEEQAAPKLSQRLLAGYTPEAQPEAAPAQPQGEDDIEQSILGAILDTAGDFATSTGFKSEAQPEWAKPIENFAEAAVGTFSPGGAATKGKGFLSALKGLGKSAATEGALGVGQGALDRVKEGGGESIADMVASLMGEGGIAAGADAALGVAGKTASKFGDAASFLARKADNTKAGSTSRIREDLIEKFGIQDGPDKLGELLRAYSPSGLFSPKTSAGHLKTIEDKLGVAGGRLTDVTRKAGAEGADAAAPAAMQGAQQSMLTKASDLDSAAYADSAAAEAERLELLLNRSVSKPLPTSFEGLIGAKSQYGGDAFRRVTGVVDEDAKSQAAKQAWMSMKDAEGQALQSATPDTAADFTASQQSFGQLSGLSESLRPRASADDAVGNIGTAAVGAVAGAMMPGGQGIMGALTSGTNNAVRQMTGGVAHDLFANVMHPTGSALRGAGSFAEGVPTGTLTAEGAEQSRGHQTSSGIRDALQSNPQAFGQYAQKLQEADEQGELSTTVGALIEDDPQFRALVKRMQGGR